MEWSCLFVCVEVSLVQVCKIIKTSDSVFFGSFWKIIGFTGVCCCSTAVMFFIQRICSSMIQLMRSPMAIDT
uniref:Putative ovule protein n=1 Tax=Solanum chacoense TaxID=4108 RepID=A0A0V0H264_SOLCH